MPLSGSVTAGSAALASQYNNLRTDVVSTTQGHTHTGVSENGAQIEGTALKSTGASNGQVLTANGSGGVSFASAGGAGQLSTLTGSAAFSTAASGVVTKLQISDTTSQPYTGLTGGGTVIIALCNTVADTGTHAIQSYYLGSTVIQGSSAIAGITAGTITYEYPHGYGYSSGTAFVIREAVKTTSPQQGYYLRKFNQTLGSNMWNATLINPASNTLSASYSDRGPFYSTSNSGDTIKYESTIGVWIGGDFRSGAMGTTDPSLRVASVWIVNDASGSVYSASFGSAGNGTSTNENARIRSVVYVPGVGTALGTVHAFGIVDQQPRWCQYTVGSASISAVSTATGASAMLANKLMASDVEQAFWSATGSAIGVCDIDSRAYTFFDRTFGTVLSTTIAQFPTVIPITSNGNDGWLDMKTGWCGRPVSSRATMRGTATNATFSSFGSAYALNSGYIMFAGAGSSTTFVFANTGGLITTTPIAGIAQIAIGSASTGRMITFRDMRQPINVSASSGYWIGDQSYGVSASNRIVTDGIRVEPKLPTLVLPAGATALVTYRSSVYNRDNTTYTSSNSDNPRAISTAVATGDGTATWLTAGGTATMYADVITLA